MEEKEQISLKLCERCKYAKESNGYYCMKLQLNVHNALKYCKGKEFKEKKD